MTWQCDARWNPRASSSSTRTAVVPACGYESDIKKRVRPGRSATREPVKLRYPLGFGINSRDAAEGGRYRKILDVCSRRRQNIQLYAIGQAWFQNRVEATLSTVNLAKQSDGSGLILRNWQILACADDSLSARLALFLIPTSSNRFGRVVPPQHHRARGGTQTRFPAMPTNRGISLFDRSTPLTLDRSGKFRSSNL